MNMSPDHTVESGFVEPQGKQKFVQEIGRWR